MSVVAARIPTLQSKIWNGSLPLEIRLAAADCRTYDESEPYLIQYPRLSYLAFLLGRLHLFFAPHLIDPTVPAQDAWLSFEGVPLKWHYPLGLLYDLFAGAEPADVDVPSDGQAAAALRDHAETTASVSSIPWKLAIHYSSFPDGQLVRLDLEGRTMHDSFINSVKEADYVRNGTARTVMSLSKEDSDNLWRSVQTHDLGMFNTVNSKLLNPPGLELRHVPIKIYLPASANRNASETISEETTVPGHIRVVQSLIPLLLPSTQPQTLGTALNTILPAIFPSRRSPIYARPILHGTAVPLAARAAELCRIAAYTDGFLHIAVKMHG